jgi:hypothetical protein
MSQTTRNEVLKKLRRRYLSAGREYKRKLLDQAQELLGYHRKAAALSGQRTDSGSIAGGHCGVKGPDAP